MSRYSLAASASLIFAPAILAQPCTPVFSDRFPTGDLNGNVNALVSFGNSLYAGGSFTTASGSTANRIARWRGQGWEPLAGGFNNAVNAMAIFDDGMGPALYAAGSFTSAGGTSANRIAKWNGAAWMPLGQGLDGAVKALAVFDEDGSGPLPPRLFAGGDFTSAGGAPASRLARWNGSTWSAVSTGCDGPVEALHVHEQGGAAALYIGGSFTTAGGVTVNRITRYNGQSFAALGSGAAGAVTALGTYDPDGPGANPAHLIAGGDFTTIGAVTASRIARWDGATWSPLGAGVNNTVKSIRVHDDGAGPALVVGGLFTVAGGAVANHIARWNGSTWSLVSSAALSGPVHAMIPFDDGRGLRLFVGGSFLIAGSSTAQRMATWDGANWSNLDRGLNAVVEALGVHNGQIYLGGNFNHADRLPARGLAGFDGTTFFPLSSGIPSGGIASLVSHDDGGGRALFIGGSFTSAGGITAHRIVRWRNGAFSPLVVGSTNGIDGNINAMTVWNDGAGPALYITGSFSAAGGTPAASIAKWTGAAWSPLGTGLNNVGNALAVYNDGTGEALYVGGAFLAAGGVPVNRIAKWNGSTWAAVGGGVNSTIQALAVYNDGSPKLYATGAFNTAGGVSANSIARWNGTSWQEVGGGLNGAGWTMAVHDEDGPGSAGPVLFVGGAFTSAGGSTATRLARWNGSTWSIVGSPGAEGADSNVNALLSSPSGLYIGGSFSSVGGISAARIARWACPQPACYANCDNSTSSPILNVADFGCFLQKFAAGDPYANCDQSTSVPTLNVADFGCFLQRFAAGCP